MWINIKMDLMKEMRLGRILYKFHIVMINSFRVVHEKRSGNCGICESPSFINFIFCYSHSFMESSYILWKEKLLCVQIDWISYGLILPILALQCSCRNEIMQNFDSLIILLNSWIYFKNGDAIWKLTKIKETFTWRLFS